MFRKEDVVSMVLRLVLVILILALASGPAAAQKGPVPAAKNVEAPAAQEVIADDPLGRSTPQGTVVGFLRAAEREEFERAAEYLDTKQPPQRAQLLARRLKYILEWGLAASVLNLSKKPEGDLGDGLRPNREKIGTVKTESGAYDILLERVQKGSDPPVWLFSADTLKLVPEIYEELDYSWVEHNIPRTLLETKLLGRSLWGWISVVAGIPLAFLVAWVVTWALFPLIKVLIRRFTRRHVEEGIARLVGPIRVLILAGALYAISLLSRSILAGLYWSGVAQTIAVIGITWLCLRLIDLVVEWCEKCPVMPVSTGGVAILRLVGKLSKGLVVVAGAVVIFYGAGINFTAMLTGLGVGGLAVAFAAQKTIENLFGGVMIVSDKPIRVGDFCQAGEYRGTVEDIGLRSTRIRTVNRTVVFVPNGQLSTMSLENFTMRDKILFNHRIGLRYETTPDQLRYIIAALRKLLYEHPKVETEGARVRFTGLKESSFEIEVFAYVLETTHDAYLQVQEDLLLRIVEIVEASGGSFAFPSRTVYVERDETGHEEKRRRAVETVRQWREQGELPFPDVAPQQIKETDKKLGYPTPESGPSRKGSN
ncbi:MAG: mechanosensitive ion channel family protein [candidate division WOR-3 bacterium]